MQRLKRIPGALIFSVAFSAEKDREQKLTAGFKVMTYNIHHANPPSKPDFVDIKAIARTIRQQQPHLVALQEVDANTGRSGKGNQAEKIAEELGMYFYFAKAIDHGESAYGNAILSKFPLKNTKTHKLPKDEAEDVEDRVMASARIKIPGRSEIIFGSIHLDYKKNSQSRILQLKEILKIANEEELPMIIAGDFNDTPGSKTIKLLDTAFTRTCEQCEPTKPANDPERAIDFIAYKQRKHQFEVKEHKVIKETYASDHLPVVATLQIINSN